MTAPPAANERRRALEPQGLPQAAWPWAAPSFFTVVGCHRLFFFLASEIEAPIHRIF
jgi:hypothetical protein